MKSHRVVFAKPVRVLLLFLLPLFAAAPGLAQETAEELYQAGLYQEEVQGNLQQAIDLFGRILIRFPGNRAVGARAQLHIGLCYEKLGQQEAQQAYRRVIADFPEHAAEVAVARDRLAEIERALDELNRQPSFQRVEIASKPRSGVLSPDGSHLAFVADGAVWTVPIQGQVGPGIAGEPTRLTEPMGAHRIGLSWSANGEWIAFNAEEEGEEGIFVIAATGGEPRRIPGNHFRGANSYSYGISLSPDGSTLAFAYDDPDAADPPEATPYSQVHLSISAIPVGGNRLVPLTPTWSIGPAYSPDGRYLAYVKYAPAEAEDRSTWRGDLWVMPAGGGTPVMLAGSVGSMAPVWSPDSRMIAFADGREVRVVPVPEDGTATGAATKISLPREGDGLLAGWTPRGEIGAFMSAPTHEAVYTVPADGGKAMQVSPQGPAFHPRWTPDGKSIVYRGSNRYSFEAVPAVGGEPKDIPIVSDPGITPGVPGGGVHVSPDGTRIVFMGATTNPLRVNIYTLPIEGGTPTRITESVSVPEMDTQDRYPCWSPDGDEIAFIRYRAVAKGDFSMNLYTVPAEGGVPEAITTDADSLAWAEVAYSPDGKWLAYFTSNAMKMMRPDGSGARKVVELEGVNFHSELAWSPDGTRIAYTESGKIWTVSTDGGQPRQVQTGVLTGDVQNLHIDWSPDGRRIAFTASTGGEPELWLISDFLPKEVER